MTDNAGPEELKRNAIEDEDDTEGHGAKRTARVSDAEEDTEGHGVRRAARAIDDESDADELIRRAADDADADTEGHSLSLLLGLGALDRARDQERSRQKVKDEELPPLTKPFPAMKDEKRK